MFSSIGAGCFLIGPDPDLAAFFDYFTRVFLMWERGAGESLLASEVLRGMSDWMKSIMHTPIAVSSNSDKSSFNSDMLKRDRSHRVKMSSFCNLHVMTSWVKIRDRLLSQQQHFGLTESSHDSLRRLLDDVQSFVRQCCYWACDISHFHSETGPIGMINSWISAEPSTLSSSLPPCCQGVMAEVLAPL